MQNVAIDDSIQSVRSVPVHEMAVGQTYRIEYVSKSHGQCVIDCLVKQILPMENDDVLVVDHKRLHWYRLPFKGTGIRRSQIRAANIIGDAAIHDKAKRLAFVLKFPRSVPIKH